MASLRFSPEAVEDLERLRAFLASDHPADADATGELIASALTLLKAHPLIGRPAGPVFRELVISRGRSGYLALYAYNPFKDHVTVTAIRHQREAGFEE